VFRGENTGARVAYLDTKKNPDAELNLRRAAIGGRKRGTGEILFSLQGGRNSAERKKPLRKGEAHKKATSRKEEGGKGAGKKKGQKTGCISAGKVRSFY